MQKVLLLSYAFPPMRVQMTPVVAKAMAGLARQGVAIDVVCAEPFEPFLKADDTLLPYVERHFGTVERLSPPDTPLKRRWRQSRRWAPVPDLMGVMHRVAFEHLMAMDLGAYDAVITFSPFHTVNPVMARVKHHRPGVRWIAQFSDPWAGNPLEPSRITRAWSRLREPGTVRAADFIVHCSAFSRDLMFARRPQDKARKSAVLPHPYDRELFPDRPKRHQDRIVFKYVGVLFDRRTPEPLFQALVRVLEKEPGWRERLRLELVGVVHPDMLRTEAAKALGPEVVVVKPFVPYVSSLAEMHDADVLVLIEANVGLNLFVPSKLSDYIGAERPILGLVPPGGSRALLDEVGGAIAHPQDIAGIAAAIEQLMRGLDDDRAYPLTPEQQTRRDQLCAQRVGERFQALLLA